QTRRWDPPPLPPAISTTTGPMTYSLRTGLQHCEDRSHISIAFRADLSETLPIAPGSLCRKARRTPLLLTTTTMDGWIFSSSVEKGAVIYSATAATARLRR